MGRARGPSEPCTFCSVLLCTLNCSKTRSIFFKVIVIRSHDISNASLMFNNIFTFVAPTELKFFQSHVVSV